MNDYSRIAHCNLTPQVQPRIVFFRIIVPQSKIQQFRIFQFDSKFKNNTNCSPHILFKKEYRTYCTNIQNNSTVKGPNIWVPSVRYVTKIHISIQNLVIQMLR